MADTGQLQACKRCSTRKIKCDKVAPRCSPCAKAGQVCFIVDTETQELLSREDIAKLEEQEMLLRAACERGESPPPASGTGTYVGEASGINILDTVFSSPQWSEPKARALKQLFNRPQIKEPEVAPAQLPTHEAALYLTTTYLQESQWQKPFLLKQEVLRLLDRMYVLGKPEEANAQDRFRLFMICAIATVPLRRRGILDLHPYSFFLAACTLTSSIPLLENLDGLMNLLLVARFSVYFNTGVSIWELGRICMRICVSLELHLPPLQQLQPLEEQHHRRIFWECYVLDRYSSTTLGRPFSIADSDIEVKLPVPFPDEEVEMQPLGTLDHLSTMTRPTTEPGPMDVFILCINLRRLTSRIHDTFFTRSLDIKTDTRSMTATADIYVKFYALLQDLDCWRQTAPIFPQPECLYQRPQWYDFMLEKERNFLVRGVIDALPQQGGAPPGQLIDLCLESAIKVIRLYADMYSAMHINCTRTYFQVLFTAGLSLIYFTSIRQAPGTSTPARPFEVTLRDCSNVLRSLSDIMPDARPFARIFDIVCEHTMPTRSTRANSEVGNDNGVEAATGAPYAGLATQFPPPMTPASNFEIPIQNNQINTVPDGTLTGLDDLWPSDWTFPEPLMTDMEAFASQFACGDFSTDVMDNFGAGWDDLSTWDGMNPL